MDIVRGPEEDLPSFRETRKRLPWPANKTTTLEHCVERICDGMQRRARRVFVPREVAVSHWTRQLLVSAATEPFVKKTAKRFVPQLEQEVQALGRAYSRHLPTTPRR